MRRGIAINCSRPEYVTISGYFSLKNVSEYPKIAPLRKIFSRPFKSISKPEPNSSMGTTGPPNRTVPSEGFNIPEMTFSRVLFPAPLWPINPRTSPRRTENEISFSARKLWVLSRWVSSATEYSFRLCILSFAILKSTDTC